MALKVSRGIKREPRRILLYGEPGVGKSTFAANAPDVLFIPTEDGCGDIDVARTDQIQSWQHYVDTMTEVIKEDHDFKWVVTDSVDWLERLIFDAVANQHGVDNVGRIKFGVGYTDALNSWRRVIKAHNQLRKRGIGTIMIAHSKTKTHNDPELEPFDRFIPRLQEKAAEILVEWADEVMFARYATETEEVQEGFSKRNKVKKGKPKRILRCQHRATAVAKNRLGMPEFIDMDWNVFESYVTGKGE